MNNQPGPLGIVYDMPAEDYHRIEAFSASGMRHLANSPWHWHNRVEVEQTRAMFNGTLVHCALLESATLAERYAIVPDGAPKKPTAAQWNAKKPSPDSVAAMAWWSDFKASCGSKLIVPADDFITTECQLEAVRNNAEVAELMSKGVAEVSIFWVDKRTGVYCKARPDFVCGMPPDIGAARIVDLKAMADNTPDGFSRAAARMGHHRQQAHYTRGFEQATGLEVEEFAFVAVSSAPPVLAVKYNLVDEAVQQGHEEVSELLELFAECRRTDHWPAYSPSQRMIDLPRYAKRSNELEVSYVTD